MTTLVTPGAAMATQRMVLTELLAAPTATRLMTVQSTRGAFTGILHIAPTALHASTLAHRHSVTEK